MLNEPAHPVHAYDPLVRILSLGFSRRLMFPPACPKSERSGAPHVSRYHTLWDAAYMLQLPQLDPGGKDDSPHPSTPLRASYAAGGVLGSRSI